jgi:hypothetical protein
MTASVRSLFAMTLLGLGPSALGAQQASAPSLIGERVRVTAPDAEPLLGVVIVRGPDVIELRQPNGEVWSVRIDGVRGIERSLGRQDNVVKGGAIGAGVGFLLGGVGGVAVMNDICGSCDPQNTRSFFAFGGVGLFAGGLIGFVIGWTTSGERWEDVPLGTARDPEVLLGLDPNQAGSVRVGLSIPLPLD